MYEAKTVYSPIGKGTHEMLDYNNTRGEARSAKDNGSKSGLLMKLEWPEEEIFDDGKQSNTLTGASHPGCCKQ